MPRYPIALVIAFQNAGLDHVAVARHLANKVRRKHISASPTVSQTTPPPVPKQTRFDFAGFYAALENITGAGELDKDSSYKEITRRQPYLKRLGEEDTTFTGYKNGKPEVLTNYLDHSIDAIAVNRNFVRFLVLLKEEKISILSNPNTSRKATPLEVIQLKHILENELTSPEALRLFKELLQKLGYN